jgi:hypothetical protein
MKNSFILYTEQKAVIDKLTDEQAGKLIKAIYAHETGEEMELDSILDLVITPFLTVLEKDKEKYEEKCEKRAQAGAKGGKQRVANQANATFAKQTQANDSKSKQEVANQADNDNEYEYDNDFKKENIKRKSASQAKAFVKPTHEEVKAYCAERKNNVDPDKFIDFYESKGWLIGKNPMKDWKACVRTWEKGGSSPPNKPTNVYVNPSQKEFDDLSGFYAN